MKDDTDHLLSSNKNASILLQSIAQLDAGQGIQRDLIEPTDEERLQHLLLKADTAVDAFEEKIQTYTTTGHRRYLNPETMIVYWESKDGDARHWYSNPRHYELGQQAYTACMTWKVARDEGLGAAMLYRLSSQ